MKKLIASKYLLSTAFAVAAFAVASSMPVFAQSQDHFGSMLPHYFNSAGAEIWGSWGPTTSGPGTTDQAAPQSSRPLYLYVKPRPSRARVH